MKTHTEIFDTFLSCWKTLAKSRDKSENHEHEHDESRQNRGEGGNRGPHNKAISWKVWEQDKVAPKASGMPGEGGGTWLRAVLT